MFDFFRNTYTVTFSISYLGHSGVTYGETIKIKADTEEEALVKAENIIKKKYECVEIHDVSINGKSTYLVR